MTLVAARRDRVIVKEVQATYGGIKVHPSDVVLDLGANIGAASRLFLDRGAGRVIAVEADPRNVRIAQKNLPERHAIVLWAAVGPKRGRMPFYVSDDRPYLSSGLSDPGRRKVIVPVITLGALLAQYRPTIVKCDIEFGEYDLPELVALPAYVHTLALELHVRWDLVYSERRQTEDQLLEQRQKAAALIASFAAQGFRVEKRKDKQAKYRAIEDDTGLGPLVKSVDAVWVR